LEDAWEFVEFRTHYESIFVVLQANCPDHEMSDAVPVDAVEDVDVRGPLSESIVGDSDGDEEGGDVREVAVGGEGALVQVGDVLLVALTVESLPGHVQVHVRDLLNLVARIHENPASGDVVDPNQGINRAPQMLQFEPVERLRFLSEGGELVTYQEDVVDVLVNVNDVLNSFERNEFAARAATRHYNMMLARAFMSAPPGYLSSLRTQFYAKFASNSIAVSRWKTVTQRLRRAVQLVRLVECTGLDFFEMGLLRASLHPLYILGQQQFHQVVAVIQHQRNQMGIDDEWTQPRTAAIESVSESGSQQMMVLKEHIQDAPHSDVADSDDEPLFSSSQPPASRNYPFLRALHKSR
jgi:hypothetical protein